MEFMREKSGLCLQAADPGVGRFPAAVPGKALALPDDRGAAALDRLRDEAPAVGACARPGEEGGTRRRAPAVGRQAFDRRPLARQQREDIFNYVFSFASSPSPGISIGESGAS